MKLISIITHNGKAHFDEFMSLCLVLAHHPQKKFKIERREPLVEELNDPDIWIVDIGERYEPENKNFDHHQDLNLAASFVLIADYLGLTPFLKQLNWWEFKDKIDRQGGFKMAQVLGIESVDPLNSPLEGFVLSQFRDDPNKMINFMKKFGHEQIEVGKKLLDSVNFWQKCNQINLKGKNVIIGHTEETTGLLNYVESLREPVHVRIIYDPRGNGWSLGTIKDAPGVDFSRIKDHQYIKFAHNKGFIAKTKDRIPIEDVYKLVEQAIL